MPAIEPDLRWPYSDCHMLNWRTMDLNENIETPEPEGLDTGTSDGWGDYPLDAVFVRTEPRSVSEVVGRIERKRYILDPDFQRDFVWSNLKQSKLIESCVMRIPLPVFYVAEAPDGRIIVVDGLQRLTTFVRYLGNQFRLTGLAGGEDRIGSHALEGKLFEELPLNLQERIQDTPLTLYILDAKAPERARLDIFERVNSGEPLTRQQMRNALYNGPATVWLKQAAEGDAFRSATGRSLNPRLMRDREAINRFCAFKLLGRKAYTTSDMDGFLAEGLNRLAKASDSERAELRLGFDRAMTLNRRLFGDHAFNISLFEVCAVAMFGLGVDVDPKALQRLREAVIGLLRNDDFSKAITYSTNSTIPVRVRFAAMEDAVATAILV